MSYAIMRMAKVKSNRDVVMSLQHNTRDRMPSNAVPEKTAQNQYHGGRTLEALARYDSLLPENVRSNAVRAVEIVMTASPDFSGDWKRYLNACDEWAQGLFGKENLLHISHHFDESTPHTHIMFVPLKDGKLNANHYIGGSRDRMAELQEDFFQKAGRPFSLERGQSKSETRSRHTAHSLSGKAAELDEREQSLSGKFSKLDEREKKLHETLTDFHNLMGLTPREVHNLKNKLKVWETMPVEQLKQFTSLLEAKGIKTVGEYIESQLEVQKKQKQKKQQEQGHNYSR
jgi:hypothetical protein